MAPNPKRAVEVVAHRGLHTSARENTVEAFELALSAGADAIELDVYTTADGIVVVHHDAAVHCRDSDIDIAGHPLTEVKAAAMEEGFQLPTLDEVLAAVAGRATIYIEVKAPDMELLVARIVRRTKERIAVHSFDHRIIKKIRDFVPGIQTGVLTVSRPVSPARLLADANASDYWPQADFVDADLVAEVHEAGARVIVWTANTPVQWERLVDLNVDGICTDNPGELREWLGSPA
jgi:glycerophosphoryl diester phosphodiesterase